MRRREERRRRAEADDRAAGLAEDVHAHLQERRRRRARAARPEPRAVRPRGRHGPQRRLPGRARTGPAGLRALVAELEERERATAPGSRSRGPFPPYSFVPEAEHERHRRARRRARRPLDRLLGGGVVIAGEITLAVADVDLVHVSLRALVSSVETAQRRNDRAAGHHRRPVAAAPPLRLVPAGEVGVVVRPRGRGGGRRRGALAARVAARGPDARARAAADPLRHPRRGRRRRGGGRGAARRASWRPRWSACAAPSRCPCAPSRPATRSRAGRARGRARAARRRRPRARAPRGARAAARRLPRRRTREVDGFVAAVRALQHEHPELSILCTGPWPPYSFAEAPER